LEAWWRSTDRHAAAAKRVQLEDPLSLEA
jgi:hypothetical protein